MRILVQRVKKALVTVENEEIAKINNGLLLFLGVVEDDSLEDIKYLVHKIAKLRIFDDENGVMNISIQDICGEILVVSQFTLLASTKKGSRPSYIRAGRPEISIPLYESFIEEIGKVIEKPVQHGKFGADMKVSLLNDGPVTIWIDSKNKEY